MQPELVTQRRQGIVAAARQVPNRLGGAATELAHRLHLPTTLVKFLFVGGIGFLINEFFLFIFYDSPIVWFFPAQDTGVDLGFVVHPDIRLLISSILAVELAVICQFNLHERWTFRQRPREGLAVLRFFKFNISSAVSPIIIVVTTNTLTPLLDLSPYISAMIGVLLGVTWNWTLTSLVIWPHREARRPGRPPDGPGPA